MQVPSHGGAGAPVPVWQHLHPVRRDVLRYHQRKHQRAVSAGQGVGSRRGSRLASSSSMQPPTCSKISGLKIKAERQRCTCSRGATSNLNDPNRAVQRAQLVWVSIGGRVWGTSLRQRAPMCSLPALPPFLFEGKICVLSPFVSPSNTLCLPVKWPTTYLNTGPLTLTPLQDCTVIPDHRPQRAGHHDPGACSGKGVPPHLPQRAGP